MAIYLTISSKLIKIAVYFSLIFACFTSTNTPAQKPSQSKLLETQKKAEELSKTWNSESYRYSIELFLQTADDWGKIEDFSKSSNCLREAARLYYLLAQYDTAVSLLQKAIIIDKRTNDYLSEANSLSLLSMIYLYKGDVSKSEISYKKALELTISSKDSAARANALYSAAKYSLDQIYSEKTIKLFEEALFYAERTNDSRLIAQILLGLSYAYLKESNPILGLKAAEKSLLMWQENNDKRGEATTYIAIALANKIMGEGQNALKAYYKAEVMFPTDIDLVEHAKLLLGIAAVYNSYNEVGSLEKNLLKAYKLYVKANYPQGQLATLPSLIKISYSTNNYANAEKYYVEVQMLSQKLKNNNYLGYTKEILGNEMLNNGHIDEAVRFYSSALNIFQKINNKKGVALINQRLGEAFERKNQNKSAKENFTSALEFNRSIKNHFEVSDTLYHLAKLDASENHNDEALKNIRESLYFTENLYSEVINAKLKQTYFSNSYDRYELYINLLMKMHKQSPDENYAIQALQATEKSRARSMLENLSLSEANFTKDADAETVKREKEIRSSLNTKADKLTDLLSKNADKAETEKTSNEINELEHELEEIKAKLKQFSPIYSAIKNPAPFDVGEFQRQILEDNSLFLEFSFGKDESYLWLVGKTEVNSYVLPPRGEIEPHIEKLRDLLASREIKQDEEIENYQTRISEADKNYWFEARSLSDKLFGQIADKLSNKRLIIVPDGKLHYFPVAALPLPNSDINEPILLTNEIIYEPSAQTLLILSKSKNQTVAPKNLLVFSDPVFSADDSRFSGENKPIGNPDTETVLVEKLRFAESLNSLSRLTASKDEADSIANIVGVSKTDTFSGFSANREQLLNAKAADYKIIHFATHGAVNEERPELSGIVLSRFDKEGRKLNESFRIQDIYGLNLNADLVVLSACQTGLGKEVKGEGVMSLNNAFLQVGAKSVVSSLWKVDDNATKELMRNFYQELASEKLTTSEALRQAKIKMLKNPQYKSPFYWAAFTLQGDFQNIPKLSNGSNHSIYLLLIFFPFLMFGIYRLAKFSRLRSRLITAPKTSK